MKHVDNRKISIPLLMTMGVCYAAMSRTHVAWTQQAVKRFDSPDAKAAAPDSIHLNPPSKLSFELRTVAKTLEDLARQQEIYSGYREGMERGELVLQPIKASPTYRFLYVPNGSFVLGMTNEERIAHITRYAKEPGGTGVSTTLGTDTSPTTRVKVVRGFFILATEVTRAQYRSLNHDSHKPDVAADEGALPATSLSWVQAADFCKQLSELTGFTVRLPTEIEWEYVARSPSGWSFPWPPQYTRISGNMFRQERVFYAHANADKLRPVPQNDSSQDISWRGAHDMAGNASEWCLDIYDRGAYGSYEQPLHTYDPYAVAPSLLKPHGPGTGRVYRGGNIHDEEVHCHVCLRRDLDETDSRPQIGFRPVLLLSTPDASSKESDE